MADDHTPSTVTSIVNDDLLPFDFDKEIPRYIQKCVYSRFSINDDRI
jgi:ATP-binding cassette subfamily G (WHITE) protein 2 (SNQ2)